MVSLIPILACSRTFSSSQEDTGNQCSPQNNDSSAENTLNSGSNQESISTPTIEISKEESRELALEKSERVQIETKRLSGSISLNGGRIDDLKLLDYNVRLNDESEKVTLLSPAGAPNAYFTMYGWAPAGSLNFDEVPGASTKWNVDGNSILTESTPCLLYTSPSPRDRG